MKKLLMMIAAALAAAAYGSVNVFNDAAFWFRGGKDGNSNGTMETGEFFDDLHANDGLHANHALQVDGYPENGALRTESVVFPALGSSVVKSMQVLHISDNERVSGESGPANRFPLLVRSRRIFAENNISNEYTLVGRFLIDRLEGTKYVMKVGYGRTGDVSRGLLLGFKEDANHPGCNYVMAWRVPESGTAYGESSLSSLYVPTNTWFDLGVAVGNGRLRVCLATSNTSESHGNNKTLAFQETTMRTEDCALLDNEDYYRFFGESGKAESAGAEAKDNGFRGSVQQLAVWRRKLEDQEIMEAFGMPRSVIFRTGFDNGASNEFGGERLGARQSIDGLGTWRGAWNEMLADDEWTVDFDALRDEAGLPQIFSLRALPGSAPSSVQLAINGTSIGTRRVHSKARSFWPVPENLIAVGANTLTIRRVDDGAGALKVDGMELGGSLGVGAVGDGNREMAKWAAMSAGIPSLANPNPMHWPRELLTYEGHSNVHFRVWIDDDVRSRSAASLRFSTKCSTKSSSYTLTGNEYWTLSVNGMDKGTCGANTDWTETSVDLAANDLRDGWNDIELKSAPWGNCYWMIDYYRFTTVLAGAFSIPPQNFIVIIR